MLITQLSVNNIKKIIRLKQRNNCFLDHKEHSHSTNNYNKIFNKKKTEVEVLIKLKVVFEKLFKFSKKKNKNIISKLCANNLISIGFIIGDSMVLFEKHLKCIEIVKINLSLKKDLIRKK